MPNENKAAPYMGGLAITELENGVVVCVYPIEGKGHSNVKVALEWRAALRFGQLLIFAAMSHLPEFLPEEEDSASHVIQ